MGTTILRPLTALALLLAAGACSSKGPRPPSPQPAGKTEAAQITMFYTSTPVVGKGEAAILCYGVTGAAKVALSPPEAAVSPSPNRCVEVRPASSRSYTLTAQGADGREMSQTVAVQVSGEARASKREPEPSGVQISYFRLDASTTENGRTYHKLCFQTWNAEQVSIDPPAFPAAKIFQGCFTVAPTTATTYRLTARDAAGRSVTRAVTVQP